MRPIRGPAAIRRALRLGIPIPAPVPEWPPIDVPIAAHLPEDDVACVEPSFALAVSHCPWLSDRVANMARCRPIIQSAGIPYHEETGRAPNHVWSRRMWGWGVAQAVTHGVYLQDDLRVAPGFWGVITAMVKAVPNRVLALLGNHPMSERALAQGYAWYRECETLGSGYVVPIGMMRTFLLWRDALSEPKAAAACEDFLLSRWQYETGRRAWCPIPSVIQTQDAEITTTNPKIYYPFRRSYITWEDPRVAGKPITDAAYWRTSLLPPDYGPAVTEDNRYPMGRSFSNADVLAAHARLARGR